MSVFKRKTTKGETKEYHYKFICGGKTFYGVCKECYDIKAAREFEANQKNLVKELASQKSVKALVENFRNELSGGVKIPLTKAFDLSLKKPRRFNASEKHIDVKRSQFDDFVQYMKAKHKDVINISDVQKMHSEGYIHYLRTNGKFNKKVSFKNRMKGGKKSSYQRTEKSLSPRTINAYHKTITEVFNLLFEDAGLHENYFSKIHLLQENSETREAFSEEELELIIKEANPFIKAIFTIGFFTAFREGDISTLRWQEVNFKTHIIRRKLIKTGKIVEVPIMPPLMEFLKNQYKVTGEDEYVLPEHAEMYKKNPSGISYRVKKFLESLGIQTTKKVAGRDRAISVKDVHSLRHTFCYFAGIAGIPLVVVQSIVGHMTPEMTAHYTAHADRKAKHEKMLLLPNLLKSLPEPEPANPEIDSNVEAKRKRLLEHLALADAGEINKFHALLEA
jgi:integrase